MRGVLKCFFPFSFFWSHAFSPVEESSAVPVVDGAAGVAAGHGAGGACIRRCMRR